MSSWRERLPFPVWVNDIHSALNAAKVRRVVRAKSPEHVAAIVKQGEPLSVSGGRHSMGGQAFLSNGILLDMRGLKRLLSLDRDRGIAMVEAGILWPELYRELRKAQSGDDFGWTFRQKQTGGDRLSLGGSISSNIHSRGLTMRPMVEDIEALHLITPEGKLLRISREENADLFPFVIGGYGLFGVITGAELRLVRRHKLRRRVEVRSVDGLIEAFDDRIREGYEFGDFQFAIDPESDDFLRSGVFACYEPVPDTTAISANQKEVPRRAWHHLVYLAHANPSEAFRLYADFYKSTDGQIYWSDLHQMTPYLDDYHRKMDRRTRAHCPGSEMITELYVPRESLTTFLDLCRSEMRQNAAKVIYGTIRLVEREKETFLPWATQNWACVIFNLHVDHDPPGLERAKTQFRTLIDLAQGFGGTFYLTYHRWATREQIERSYPMMEQILCEKRKRDPNEILCSDWYLHLKSLFGVA